MRVRTGIEMAWERPGSLRRAAKPFREPSGHLGDARLSMGRWVGWLAAIVFIAGMILLRRLLPV
jgi:hypothetical protein